MTISEQISVHLFFQRLQRESVTWLTKNNRIYHWGYAVVCLSPVIEAFTKTTIPDSVTEVKQTTVGLIRLSKFHDSIFLPTYPSCALTYITAAVLVAFKISLKIVEQQSCTGPLQWLAKLPRLPAVLNQPAPIGLWLTLDCWPSRCLVSHCSGHLQSCHHAYSSLCKLSHPSLLTQSILILACQCMIFHLRYFELKGTKSESLSVATLLSDVLVILLLSDVLVILLLSGVLVIFLLSDGASRRRYG